MIVSFTGRQVAVDWAVAKNQYVATQQASSAGKVYVFCDTVLFHLLIMLREWYTNK